MKSFLSFFVSFFICSMSFAGPVSQADALRRAVQFMNARSRGIAPGDMSLAKRQPRRPSAAVHAAVADAASYYVFNIGTADGFVIVSGDDSASSILGYSDSGHFDVASMPDNVSNWLRGYESQIEWTSLHRASSPSCDEVSLPLKKAPSVRHSVSPLLTTKWDQGNPYNTHIYPPGYQMPVTGCVATAMAQLLNYHGQRTGRPACVADDIPVYNPPVSGTPKGTAIDWENMQDTYLEDAVIESEEQQKQVDAVAQLMLMCGTSVEMRYSSVLSEASVYDVPQALKKYFGYDAATRLLRRSDYAVADWESMIYNELLESRPVIYSGTSSGGGHSFVVDGFDGDEMFHINWGWGGANDGYFRLSVANPADKSGAGAGSADDGYTILQDAIVGAQPDAGTVPDGLQLTLESIGTENNVITFNALNFNEKSTDFEVGIGYIDDSGEIDCIASSVQNYSAALVSGNEIHVEGYVLKFPVTSIPADICKIVAMSREVGDAKWLTPMNAKDYYVEAARTSGGIALRLVQPAALTPKLALVGDLALNRNTSGRSRQQIEARVENSGDEFYGELVLTSKLVGSSLAAAQRIGATILGGETDTLSFSFSPKEIGDYAVTLSYTDADNKEIVLGRDTIYAPAKVRSNVELGVSLAIENADKPGGNILGNKAHLVTTLENDTDDDYEGTILPLLMLGGGSVSFQTNVKTFIAAHETVVMEHDFDVQTGSYYRPVCIVQDLNTYKPHYGELYKAIPAVTVFKADGRYLSQEATERVDIPYDAVAVDLTGNSTTRKVVPSANANCLYYLSDDAETPEGLTVNIVKGTHCDSLHIFDDALPFMPVYDFTADTVAYTRLFDKGITAMAADGDTVVSYSWSTLCLPFAADRCQLADGTAVGWMRPGSGGTPHEFWLMEYEGDEYGTLFFAPSQALNAYTPYMIAVPGRGLKDLPDMTAMPATFYGGSATVRAAEKNVASSTNYKFVGTTKGATDSNKTYSIATDGSHCSQEPVAVKPFRAYVKAMANARTAPTVPISFMADISVSPSGDIPFVKGDVNGDGAVNVADISAVISVMAGEDHSGWRNAADVNGDGAVNVADISAIIGIMAE